jgi:CelD/BcsL family acetyltransferase involved in cellulose biosynthesis
MPRPSPFQLHGWLLTWWRHYGKGQRLAIEVAFRDDRLVGAFALHVRRRAGVRVATFLGGSQSALGDVLLAEDEGDDVAAELVRRAAGGRHDLLDLFGLPEDSRFARVAEGRLLLMERVEAPVLDLSEGWGAVYEKKTTSKKRNLHRRRRRQLEELGAVEVEVASTPEALGRALEDAFDLHRRRWEGRPDTSGFATPEGEAFHRAATQALAADGIPRIVTLRLDGRAVAFHYYMALWGGMYVYRLAFDPEFSRVSPGLVNTLDAITAAGDEGATRVEFLGSNERYKVELADRYAPMFQALGLARTPIGHAVAAGHAGGIMARRRLKRSKTVRTIYVKGLAPLRRLRARARRRGDD